MLDEKSSNTASVVVCAPVRRLQPKKLAELAVYLAPRRYLSLLLGR